ncbi:ATP-binding protein [Bradyrhizobium neotropicale]|uniref:ATP-binding protein n=1 Tax=Bradyrhizobium neotropicale TaxID=1497615 RepID=UPI000A61BBDC|nr:ATP-binding protein [Bradyrhizobium neotropicale]
MTMTLIEIDRCLRQFRLSGIRDTLETRVLQAQGASQPFLETFCLLLQDELDRRQSCLIARRYQQSGLEEKLTLAEFDWSFNPNLPRQACFQLHTLKFVAVGENALLIGKPGTGKSHVAKAVAYQAIQGHKVQSRGFIVAATDGARSGSYQRLKVVARNHPYECRIPERRPQALQNFCVE